MRSCPKYFSQCRRTRLDYEVFGQKIDLPIFLSPTAIQRLYHHDGDKASARAAEKLGLFTVCQPWRLHRSKKSQIYLAVQNFSVVYTQDQGLTDNLIDRCKSSGFKAMCLTVDTVVAGNRKRSQMGIYYSSKHFKSLASFAMHPKWAFNYLTQKFQLANVLTGQKRDQVLLKASWII